MRRLYHLCAKAMRFARYKLEGAFIKTFPARASKALYKKTFGEPLDLKNPRDFNSKLKWLDLYWKDPLILTCVDKYAVRDFVTSRGCEELLYGLYGVWERADNIDWNALPQKFVLKVTNGCGLNIFCENKDALDKDATVHELRMWCKYPYGIRSVDLNCSRIKPRIICEEYLESESSPFPNDYKFYCFNGEAKLVLVCRDRGMGIKLDWLDLEWHRLDVGCPETNKGSLPAKPESFEKMVRSAEILSRGFPFVRVDLYEVDHKPLFGEMTFTPASCIAQYYNDAGLRLLGDWLELPKRKWTRKHSTRQESLPVGSDEAAEDG